MFHHFFFCVCRSSLFIFLLSISPSFIKLSVCLFIYFSLYVSVLCLLYPLRFPLFICVFVPLLSVSFYPFTLSLSIYQFIRLLVFLCMYFLGSFRVFCSQFSLFPFLSSQFRVFPFSLSVSIFMFFSFTQFILCIYFLSSFCVFCSLFSLFSFLSFQFCFFHFSLSLSIFLFYSFT